MPDPRHTARWRQVRALVLNGATRCQVPGCLHPDEPLRHDVARGHPLKATVDHLIPVSKTEGWSQSEREAALYDPRYLRPAHHSCNNARNRTRVARKLRQRLDPPSRDWGVGMRPTSAEQNPTSRDWGV